VTQRCKSCKKDGARPRHIGECLDLPDSPGVSLGAARPREAQGPTSGNTGESVLCCVAV